MPTSNIDLDQRFMSLALTLGRRGLGNTWPNPSVGAVVVRHDGAEPVIVGRGWTQPGGRPHAETEALRRAGPAARGATLYVTLEPCSHHGKTPPCTDAIIAAGIARVVSAIEDPNARVAGRGHSLLRASGITVDVGVGAAEARRAHAGHIRSVCDHRPHISLKLAVSADEKAGLAGRRPAPITGEAARSRVHLMRAMNDAILIGIGTSLADDPQLTCRLPGMASRSPVRVVLDTGLRLPATGALASSARETPVWVMAGESAPEAAEAALVPRGVEVFRLQATEGMSDMARPPFFSPPPIEVGSTRLRSLNSLTETRVDAVSAGEGSGVGVARGGTTLPQPPDPPPSPSRTRGYAGFGQSIKRSKSATADFDRGEREEAAAPYATSPPATGGKLDILAVVHLLAERGITRLMVEGGPTVAAAFLAADLVDEAVLLRGPNPIGPDGIDALEAMPLTALTDSPRLRSRSIETVGEDTIETFERS
jgi:diaminohydroxyphosphoribosylaminopyrimidine deaminase / 5-amino-6-(5-phosphoribosylamino)uracil reductase